MTEEEKRIKKIKDIVNIFETVRGIAHCEISCQECVKGNFVCNDYRYAEAVVDYILRREEEVQKETAKEIYKALLGTERIKGTLKEEQLEIEISLWRLEDLNRVFKDFGVEVEE